MDLHIFTSSAFPEMSFILWLGLFFFFVDRSFVLLHLTVMVITAFSVKLSSQSQWYSLTFNG